MIGARWHGKDVIDSINSCDKCYLMGEVCMIGTPETDDNEKKINSNSMVGNTDCSITKEHECLCKDEIKINGAKSHRKFKKREGNTKVKKEFFAYKIKIMLRWRE